MAQRCLLKVPVTVASGASSFHAAVNGSGKEWKLNCQSDSSCTADYLNNPGGFLLSAGQTEGEQQEEEKSESSKEKLLSSLGLEYVATGKVS